MVLSPAYEAHPEHRLEIDATPVRLRIHAGGRMIAETRRGLRLREGRYPAVYYVPREDVRMERAKRSEHTTHCPFKGDASYYDFEGNEGPIEQAAWSYEDPFDQMAAIRSHLAFYTDRVAIEVEAG